MSSCMHVIVQPYRTRARSMYMYACTHIGRMSEENGVAAAESPKDSAEERVRDGNAEELVLTVRGVSCVLANA